MDFIERSFSKIWLTKKKRLEALESTVKASEIQKYLELVVSYSLPEKFSPQIFGSLWSCGFYEDALFLPEAIGFSKEFNFNRQSYFYLTLKSCGVRALELKSISLQSSWVAQRLEALTYMPEINTWLDKRFPFFQDFEKSHLKDLKKKLNLKRGCSKEVFNFWDEMISKRDTGSAEQYLRKASALIKMQKYRDELPEYLHYTTPQLWDCGENFVSQLKSADIVSSSQDPKDQQQRDRSERPQKANEEDEDLNPVTHSFEKLEAADDYDGGRKVDFSEEDLEETMNSLDEVELNQVTTEGDTTKSTYQQDGQFFTSGGAEESLGTASAAFSYPEWNQKKRVYIKNFCKVYVTDQKEIEASGVVEDLSFHREILIKYKRDIVIWGRRIADLFNEPLWLRRQKEGPEIDIDALVRSQTDFIAGVTPSSDFYAVKKCSIKNLTVLILFDQSLSTDSWVANRRVLDVIKESIGVMGLIFEKFLSSVMVAGVSSATRHRIDFQIYKNFNDKWSEFFKKAALIEPRGYTRLGPALRHATQCLKKVEGGKKLLLVLTDGKPTDLDCYEGAHGVSDVRKAVMEAEKLGFSVEALTIEKESKEQFSKMFRKFTVIQSPDSLAESLYMILMRALKER